MTGTKAKKAGHIAFTALVCLLVAIIAAILILFFLLYRKVDKMSRNAVGVVPEAIVLPDETAEPPQLVDIDETSDIHVPGVYDPDLYSYDPWLDSDSDNPYYDPEGTPEPDVPDITVSDDPIYHYTPVNGDVVNILLIGNDARDSHDHGRADTMIVLSYNRRARSVKLVSFLRDIWIYIPGRDRWNRLNTAFRYGGCGLAVNTINVNFGLDIQRYVRVDFNHMKVIVNRIGGIDIVLTEREVDYINANCSDKLPRGAGLKHLNGAQTLVHARNRRIGGDGDWGRTRRQREVMNAIFNKIREEENMSTIGALLLDFMDNVETNLSVSEVNSLATDVLFGGNLNIENAVVPFAGTWHYAWESGMAVIRIDIPANKARLRALLYG
ncbi:MAG: LCP family protein [Clostridia bacterium]|nr:LCP family protein [Clostridia bacterium]